MSKNERAPESALKGFLRGAGSLWFAALLFLLLMVAMGAATVFESSFGTERVGVAFYHSWWYHGILVLIGVNTLFAILARLPLRNRDIPFLVTHAGIILVLVGALVSVMSGVNGRLVIAEGETGSKILIPGEMLTLSTLPGHGPEGHSAAPQGEPKVVSVDLSDRIKDPYKAINDPLVKVLESGPIRLEVLKYMPDIEWEREILNDNPNPHLAFQVALIGNDKEETAWAFADAGQHNHQQAVLAGRAVAVRTITDPAEWTQMTTGKGDRSQGKIKVIYNNKTYEFVLEDCMKEPVPVSDTGLTIKVLRYMPHATVGPMKKVVNASNSPINPAIEIEIVRGEKKQRRLSFAKFPDHMQQMGRKGDDQLRVVFVSTATQPMVAPIELLTGPDGALFARFAWAGASMVRSEIKINQPVTTPWPGQTFAVRQRLDNSRVNFKPTQPNPIRKKRQAAILVRVTGPDVSQDVWLQKYGQRSIRLPNQMFMVSYNDNTVDLDFKVKLDKFRIGYYPGGGRPRSFESSITILDPMSGREQGRSISMNHPTSYGGYTFYQSSYQKGRNGMVSILRVAKDWGRPIVYVGYFALMGGMVLVLVQRILTAKQKASPDPDDGPKAAEDSAKGGE